MRGMLNKVFSTFVARFFIAASSFAIAILVSNYIGASGRGEQSLLITLIAFIIIISSIVGSASLSYLVPRFPFLTLIIPSYAWATAIAGICLIFLPYTRLIPSQYSVDVCILSWILALFNTNISVLIAKQRINTSNVLTALQSLLVIIALVVLFAGFKEKTIRSYITALYISYGISLVVSLWVIRIYFEIPGAPAPWRSALKNLATLGFYNQIAVFAQMLSFRLSYYILNQYSGTAEVGIYSNAVSVAESLWLIGRSIGVVQHSRIVNNNDDNFARKLTSEMNLLNLALAGSLLVIMAFIPSGWYQWLFGEEFTGINRLIWALSPGIVFFGIVLILGYYFSSTGRHYVNAICSSAGLVVTLVAGFILIPSYRGMGAAITSSFSYGLTAMLVVLFYRRQLQKNFKKKQ